jgi:DNA-binding GntR family transcriptional regulator
MTQAVRPVYPGYVTVPDVKDVPRVNDPRPAYEQIAEHLRGQVKTGQVKVGTRLPSQRELALLYRVAPGTLRQALDILAAEGIVSRGSTRGTFVLKMPGEPDPSPEYVRLTEQIGDLADRLTAVEKKLRGERGE